MTDRKPKAEPEVAKPDDRPPVPVPGLYHLIPVLERLAAGPVERGRWGYPIGLGSGGE